MATQDETLLESELAIDLIKRYKVFLLNDDYTTMDFVVQVLVQIFHKNITEAEEIMLKIHNNGQGLCGVYSYEIAETKVAMVAQAAKENGFVLKAIMEEE